MNNNKISFQSDNEDDKFDISDSDEFYSETEKALLKKALKQRNDYEDSEEEIYEINSSTDDENSEDSEENADSDIEKIDDNIPDDRAWGKSKKSYYSTDYVDADLNAFNAKDVDAAQFEEEEARKIQQRLLDQFDENDFSLDVYKPKEKVNEESQVATKIKKDLSKFLESEKRDLILKESPELLGLIEDFKIKTNEIFETLGPLLDILRRNNYTNDYFYQYITLKYNILMRYLTYVNFYILLKSERINVKYHPAVKQIIKYRELCNQLDNINTDVIKTKIHKILTSKKIDTKKPVINQKSITTKLKSNVTKKAKKEKPKQVHFDLDNNLNENDTDSENEEKDNLDAQNGSMEEDNSTENGKRAITYEIAKNKGLTPHRKKEQRNPRVKHRNKYRQAKIRRKGAVREVRKELSRYGGELSGIKSNVTKSIKIK